MIPISIEDVRNAVILSLEQHFPEVDVYGEKVAHGFQKPCFYVKLLSVKHKQELGRRYKRNHSFEIHYYSEETEINKMAHRMADRLYQYLEFILLNDGICRGRNMDHEVINGVIHFFVNYDFHVMKKKKQKIRKCKS